MAKKPTTEKGKRADGKPRRKGVTGKTRGDGTPTGQATTPQPHGGAIGNPPFEKTAEQSALVRRLASVFPLHGEHLLAAKVGISRPTLRKYFADELLLGRADMVASVGSQVISRAINADAVDDEGNPVAKGDLEAQKFVLARLGGWTTKVDTSEQGQQPFGGTVDLSNLTDEELELYGALAAKAEGREVEAERDG